MAIDVEGFINEEIAKSDGALAEDWREMLDFYNRKLWHQLTLKLLQFVKKPELSTGTALINLYNNLVKDFEHKMKPIALVQIVIPSFKQFPTSDEGVKFLQEIKEKVKSSKDAVVLCLTTIGDMYVAEQRYPEAKIIIRECEGELDELEQVCIAHSMFYRLSSEYYRLMADYTNYYRDALRYLGCVQLSDISKDDQAQMAYNVGLAALLGKNIFNFGELLMHPVLKSVEGTEKAWLIDVLAAFNAGDVTVFESLQSKWSTQPDLAASQVILRQKISLLCLMEMTFRRPATDRQLTFEEIASQTKLPVNEVEFLVMRALSLGLVKGKIDQMNQKVFLNWVQPRVLSLDQVAIMKQRIDQWCANVKSMEMLVEDTGHDILS